VKFGSVALDQAIGHILAHNLVDANGHKVLSKGRLLTQADYETLQRLGMENVVVAMLNPNDLNENEAAERVGQAVAGPGVEVVTPGVGRANLIAEHYGPLYINIPALEQLNNIDEGITLATLRNHTLVQPGELITLVKIIPFVMPSARVVDVESKARELSPIISVRPLKTYSVALIVSGPHSVEDRLTKAFEGPTRTRIEKLNSRLDTVCYVEHVSESIAEAIQVQSGEGRDLILVAGISAIIDRDDVVPTALRQAGGDVTHFGVPVDPGTLLMLGYLGDVPVLGAPGCIKSAKTNVIDWLLPRLLAGERLTRADLVALGHGGLLDDISDRPMPRSALT
jgi:molybdenum cofactor cytidylyltransferase